MDSLDVVATTPPIHPCVTCGACCATYRVLFKPEECGADSYRVPKELTEKVDANTLAILGTNSHKPRCVALSGRIGHAVGCTIYANRPGCCREFKPSFEDGIQNPRCDEARRGKGLKPLRSRNWEAFQEADDTLRL